ncbi:class I SAM-dependent methyltransferase [Clostridium carnis]
MFKYVGEITDIAQSIIKNFLCERNIAIDATLGNGYDSDFLSENFKSVYSFDIQSIACTLYLEKEKDNVKVINDSHDKFDIYIKEEVDCIMYNLGFLPGGNKEITTIHSTTIESLKIGLSLLKKGGIITICIYNGHNEGKKEETCILEFLQNLPKSKYGVMLHSYLNRSSVAPILAVIEKK